MLLAANLLSPSTVYAVSRRMWHAPDHAQRPHMPSDVSEAHSRERNWMNVLLVKALANGLKAWWRCQTLDGWLLQWSVRVSRFWRTICESSVPYPLPMTKEIARIPSCTHAKKFERSVLYPCQKITRVPSCTHVKKIARVPSCTHAKQIARVPSCTHAKKIARVLSCTHGFLHASTRTTLIQLRTRILWSATSCMIFLSSASDLEFCP